MQNPNLSIRYNPGGGGLGDGETPVEPGSGAPAGLLRQGIPDVSPSPYPPPPELFRQIRVLQSKGRGLLLRVYPIMFGEYEDILPILCKPLFFILITQTAGIKLLEVWVSTAAKTSGIPRWSRL